MKSSKLDPSQSAATLRCKDLIGMPYELGADGSNGKIDCIHLVSYVLSDLGIPFPEIDPAWYDHSAREIRKNIEQWGTKVVAPNYDGDILVAT